MSSLATVMYLSASYFTRLYDMSKQTYAVHPVLHEGHEPDLLRHDRIVIPVAIQDHWASIWIYTARRKIKCLDSYFQGGATYAKAIKAIWKTSKSP